MRTTVRSAFVADLWYNVSKLMPEQDRKSSQARINQSY